MRHVRTEWGTRLKMFSLKYGITIEEICNRAGVKPSTVYAMIIGKTPGFRSTPKIDEFMARYEAAQALPQSSVDTPILQRPTNNSLPTP